MSSFLPPSLLVYSILTSIYALNLLQRKLLTTGLYGLTTMSSTFASSIFSSAGRYYGEEFGLSTETTVLGVSLFILGYVSHDKGFLIAIGLIIVKGRLNLTSGIAGSWASHMGTSIRRIRKEILNPRSGLYLRLFHCGDGCSQGSAGKVHLLVTSGSTPQLIWICLVILDNICYPVLSRLVCLSGTSHIQSERSYPDGPVTNRFSIIFQPVTTVGGGLADMWDQKERGSAVVFYSLAVVAGPTLG